jgi:LCP family protein required for cell wall assembly
MRKWARKIAVALSIAVVLTSGGFHFFSKAASSAIPRSKALQGAPQSKNGDTNILLIGLDSRRDNEGKPIPAEISKLLHVGPASIGGYNTNTLILIHVPADGKKAVALSIPRDNYVNVPGYGMKKIKEAYSYAKYAEDSKLYKEGVQQPTRERLARDAGRVSTIATVSEFLDVPIDHFAEVNMIGFYDLANALGGIQVCLKNAVNDPKYSGAVFPAGLQTITGADALKFVRQRHGLPNGDLDRTHRQQAFIAGVITKFRTQGIFGDIGKVSALLDVAKKDVVIDSGFDVIGFLPQAKALTGGNIKFHTLPIEGYVMRNSQSVNLVDEVKIRKLVQELFNPKPKDPKATPTAKPTPKPTKINYANLASGKAVDGSKIPCVN